MSILPENDDQIIPELIQDVIRATCEHSVKMVESAAEAIDHLASEPDVQVDFYLPDIQMPGIDGVEIRKALHDCGAVDVIAKPFDPVALGNKARNALRDTRPAC